MSIYVYIIFYLIFSSLGLVLMKIGSTNTSVDLLKDKIMFNMQYELIFGVICYVISFSLWLLILKNYRLNFIFPIVSGLGYICILLASYIILKERITLVQLIGCMVILIGVVIVNIKR